MTPIKYLKGNALIQRTQETTIIAHICNDIGTWGKGFVLAISKQWKQPEWAYKQWYETRGSNDFQLGSIQIVKVGTKTYVANMIAQHGIKKIWNKVPIRYEAVERCLQKLSREALQLKAVVQMPRIGCGLAGGNWQAIQKIIQKQLLSAGVQVTVFDLD